MQITREIISGIQDTPWLGRQLVGRQEGGWVEVYDMRGNIISAARYSEDEGGWYYCVPYPHP
ncbi:MAG: hypothetical protein AB1472_07045 [Candidatus Omnitrophota bacterium]